MKKMKLIAGLIVAAAMCGCASDKGKMNMSDADAQQVESSHAQIKEAAAPNLTSQTHYAAGQLAESSGAPDAAIKQYNEALRVDPTNMAAMFRLGAVYAELKRFDDAIGIWQRYVKATNYSGSAYANLALCYEMAGRPADAEAQYLAGIKRDNLNAACRTNYGVMLARHNRVPDAIRIWQPVLSPAEIHYNLASIYEMSGRMHEARIEFNKALELDPKLIDAKSRLAQLDTD